MPYTKEAIRERYDRYSSEQITQKANDFNINKLREDLQERIDMLEARLDEAAFQLERVKDAPSKSIPEQISNALSLMTVQRSVSIPVTVDQGGTGLTNNNYFYMGGNPDSDGTWRFAISGNDLLVQRRESGSWVEKSAFLAS